MSERRVQIARIALSLTITGLTVPAAAEHRSVDVSELARCAAISSASNRLACYDSLAAVAAPGVRNTPADAAASAAPASVAQAPAAAAGSDDRDRASTGRSTNPDDPANFGLTLHQLRAVPTAPDAIRAVVSQLTEDRLNNVYLVLDNGQTWGFIEPEPRVRPGDAVTIKRAALGSYLMTTPSRRSYRVQRIH